MRRRRRARDREKEGSLGEEQELNTRRFHSMAVAQTWEKRRQERKEAGHGSAVDDAKHARLFRRHLYIAAEDPALLDLVLRHFCSGSCTGIDKARACNLVLCFLCWKSVH